MATITGTSGNDQETPLYGTINSDRYRGLSGDDWFFVGTGNDTIEGGSGFDVVLYEWDALDWVKINLTNTQRYGIAAQTVLKSNGQIDTLSSVEGIHGTEGNDLILLAGGGYTFDGAGNDVIYIYDNSHVFLGGGNDRIIGTGSAWINLDNIASPYSEIGVTILFSRQGTGTIFDAAAGTMDSFRGIRGVTGTLLNDSVFGGSGNDLAEGLGGDDFMSGAGGNDSLAGGDGNDTLDGGSGSNVLQGGDGDDTYLFSFEGFTSIEDSFGSNRLQVEKLRWFDPDDTYFKELIRDGNALILRGSDGSELVFEDSSALAGITWFSPIEERSEYYMAMEDLYIGTAADDVLQSQSEGYAELFGGGGNDLLSVGNGTALLTGDGGDDTLYGGEGDDGLQGDQNADDPGNDLLSGGGGNDRLWGGDGNDRLNGDAGDDLLEGGYGNDTLDDGVGTDTLDGGEGMDTFQRNLSLDYQDYSFTTVVDLAAGKSYAVGFEDDFDTLVSLENVDLTGNFDDNILGDTGSNTFNGNNGNDLLDGRGGNDALYGGAGHDSLIGGTGADTLIGGAGNDIYTTDGSDIITEAANDGTDTVQSLVTYTLGLNIENMVLLGSAAISGTGNTLSNTITGNAASNVLDGGLGNDTLDGAGGADTLTGGTGNDSFITDGNDVIIEAVVGGTDTVRSSATHTLAANVENLTLTGTAAINGTGNILNNLLTGNNGANALDGGSGNDSLTGGDGADSLIGGLGTDQLTGGNGADSFVFKTALESANILATVDSITDFVRGQDRIDLSAIDASATLTGNNAFVWLGTAALRTATSGDLRYQKYDNAGTANDYTMVIADTDSDTASEFMIKLVGLYDLTATDFML